MKSKLVILAFPILSFFIANNELKRHSIIYYGDIAGYYIYLPAIFIYNDLQISFPTGIDNGGFIRPQPNGRILLKYPLGVAVLEAPFFFMAHAYCLLDHHYPADGFSKPYQIAGIVSTVFWAAMGLLFLRKLLKRHFDENAVSLTLLTIAFGTVLFYYTAYGPGMSHPFSFFLFSCILYLTDSWYRNLKPRHLYLIAFLLGLVFVTRPVNLLIITALLLWKVHSKQSLHQRGLLLKKEYKQILVAALFFAVAPALQFAYWKHVTGHFLADSYPNEFFDFSSPKILEGLFGFRKGWFIYTPVAFIGMLGFYHLWKKHRGLVAPLIITLAIAVYVVFSWKNWWYGGGFGSRPMLEYMSLVAIPLAALSEAVFRAGKRLISYTCTALVLCFIALNMFQSYQFSQGVIHHDRMTRQYYFKVWGKTKIDPAAYEQYLMDEHEYWKEMAETIKP